MFYGRQGTHGYSFIGSSSSYFTVLSLVNKGNPGYLLFMGLKLVKPYALDALPLGKALPRFFTLYLNAPLHTNDLLVN
jgi:hypothetical protein